MWIKSFRLRRRPIAIALACILVLVAVTTFAFLNDERKSVISVAQLQKALSKAAPESMQPAPDLEKSIVERIKRGQHTFRYDTFGDEAFWGDTLQLHKAIAGQKLGGVGSGVSPNQALAVGLKVDVEALPKNLVKDLKAGKVNLNDPASTLVLLENDAVVGLTGFFDKKGNLSSIGIQCALCHSTVDDSFASGIGKRLDGWANRDLNVGAIISLAPNLQVIADRLGVDVATVKKVLAAWGPGKYDALLLMDGKGFGPDGKSAAVLLPPIFSLSGINLHTWTGWGSLVHWNAYVGNTQMRGKGTFFDPRLNNPDKYPIAVKTGDWNIRNKPDLITPKLADLHVYQLALIAPPAPKNSYDKKAAQRGEKLFNEKAMCARCHVPPVYSEPGWNMHTPEEIGIDAFQADRSPDNRYRTSPLQGLWTHQKGGFFHDGRFADLKEVVEHYNTVFELTLTEREKNDLVEFLKSI